MPEKLHSYGSPVNPDPLHCARNCARETPSDVLEIAGTHDVVAIEHRARLVAVTVIATRSGTPALAILRTAVRRQS